MDVGFPIPDLSMATVADDLGAQLANGGEYTSIDKFAELVSTLSDETKEVYHLAINGHVIQDPMECYLSSPMVSSSQLKAALNSPRHFAASRKPKEGKQARHFELGTFTHEAILEPSRFDKVVVEPKAGRNSIQGLSELIKFYAEITTATSQADFVIGNKMETLKKQLEELTAEATAQGIEVVSAVDMAVIEQIRTSINEYGGGIIPRILRHAQTETSMYYRDRENGIDLRIRPDGILLDENLGANIIVSVKTTSAQNLNLFMRDCVKHRYGLAEAMYLDVASKATGRKFSGTLMIMAQTVEPYNVAAIYWSLDDLNAGFADYYRAMPIAKQVLTTGIAPGYEVVAEEDHLGIIESFITNR